jgi:D-alanyl-D-alanine carboxypeptidase
MRRLILPALAVAAFSGAIPTTTAAQSPLSGQLTHELALAGPASGAYVYDLNTSTPLFAERATTARPPASVEKLYTAATALDPLNDRARHGTDGAEGTLGR